MSAVRIENLSKTYPPAFPRLKKFFRLPVKPSVSVLLTSHNLAEIEELCDCVAIIARGEIRAVGTLENLPRAQRRRQRVKISFGGSVETSRRTKF